MKKSAKHGNSNPQSTNVVIKCPECKEFKWSYFFQKHWDKHHKHAKDPMPTNIETAIAISEHERGYFRRGQKRLGKKRQSSDSAKAARKKKSKGGGANDDWLQLIFSIFSEFQNRRSTD